MISRRFEFDDYPRDADLLVEFMDQCKAICPDFKATVFAVPQLMKRRHWQPLHARREWVQVGVHGFAHEKRETRTPEVYNAKMHILKHAMQDPAWAHVFKSGWWAYSGDFIRKVAALGFVVGIACIDDEWGFPMPDNIMAYCWNDTLARDDLPKFFHWSFHPIQRKASEFKLAKTSISDRFRREYLDSLKPDDRFEFVADVAESLCVKLNLGCGRQVWPGWQCLDAHSTAEGVRRWQWPHRIPYTCCRADIVFMSHFLEYIPEKSYADLFLDVWRVLRPCGVFRISDLDGWVWRPIGCERTRHTGRIESHPTLDKVRRALWDVGFHVFPSAPGQTISPHRDVLQGDTRARIWRKEKKFYLEAVKAVATPSIKRVRWHDPRMARSGHYFHVNMPGIVNLFFNHSKVIGNRREIVK